MKNPSANSCVCVVCGAKATVFVSFVQNGAVSKLYYCADHAKAAGVVDSKLYDIVGDDNRAVVEQISACNVCHKCNMSQAAFLAEKKFGCSNCYIAFSEFAGKLVNRLYEDPLHIGKIPKRFVDNGLIERRLDYFCKKMDTLLAMENYEQAAVLRDKIKYLKDRSKCTN